MGSLNAAALLVLLSCAVITTNARNTKLKEVFGWKQIDFSFPNEEARQTAILTGAFVTKNNLPLGVEAWRNRVFVTVPRWKSGIPATLAYAIVNPELNSTSPKLIPYPNWEANKLPEGELAENDTRIVSTFRIRVDACDRLWVIDTGLADILGTPKVYFKPQILIYDLHTDNLVRKYTLKDDDLSEDSFFANIIVDTDGEDNCADAYAYIPDLGGYSIIVYSFKENTSWKVKHHYFYFDPLNGNYNIGGINFQWTDGVFGISLSKRNPDNYKTAYFHALSSLNEFSVSTEILRNKSIASDRHHEYKLLGTRGPNGQSSASFIDEKTGVMFYTLVNKDALGCWNTNEKTYMPENQGIVATDSETMIFTNDVKVDRDGNLWVLSDKMPVYRYSELDPELVNFRVFTAKVSDAIKDTACEMAVKKDETPKEMTMMTEEEKKMPEEMMMMTEEKKKPEEMMAMMEEKKPEEMMMTEEKKKMPEEMMMMTEEKKMEMKVAVESPKK